MKITAAIISAACCLSLTSCFTGIESTPRITVKEVERNVASVNPEAEMAARLYPEAATSWKPGRRFLATDPKISLIFEKEPTVKPGEILIFDSLSAERSITGDTISVLTFHREAEAGTNETLRYKVGVAPGSLSEFFTLPMSVDLATVENARRLLTGRTFYIISSLRVDSNLRPTAGGRKYVAATITNVSPGNADYPLLVDIAEESGKESAVAMTAGASRSSTRNFDKIFELSDPRTRYPAITDNVWDNIVNSRVSSGMTTTECRLAIGTPNDIKKWHNGGSFFEGWACDNGRYLIFVDGLLSEIR